MLNFSSKIIGLSFSGKPGTDWRTLTYNIHYRKGFQLNQSGLILVQKRVEMEPFWSRVLLRIWTKIAQFKSGPNCDFARDLDQKCDFDAK